MLLSALLLASLPAALAQGSSARSVAPVSSASASVSEVHLAATGAAPAPSGTSGAGGTVLSTNGERRRTIDLSSEVELVDGKWSGEDTCAPGHQGQRTNASSAVMRMMIATDVAGFALSHSFGSVGELSLSAASGGGSVDSPEERGPAQLASGCKISYVWKRENIGQPEQVELRMSLPVPSDGGSSSEGSSDGGDSDGGDSAGARKRQEDQSGAQEVWGRINAITLFDVQDELGALQAGAAFPVFKDGQAADGSQPTPAPGVAPSQSSGAPGQSGSATPSGPSASQSGSATPSGPSASSPSGEPPAASDNAGAGALAVPTALAAIVAAAILLV